jgi:hypothetical protein
MREDSTRETFPDHFLGYRLGGRDLSTLKGSNIPYDMPTVWAV